MLGDLSAAYESGKRGSAAVGWDRGGQLSLGKYQIAFKPGRVREYLAMCKEKYPKIYELLGPHYGTITPGVESKKCDFARKWVELAEAGILEDSEHRFIKATHFDLAFKNIPGGIQVLIASSMTLQDVLWSTAVQHGPSGAKKIFTRAYIKNITVQEMIIAIYAIRSTRVQNSTRLKQSTRAAVLNRYGYEKKQALGMLRNEAG